MIRTSARPGHAFVREFKDVVLEDVVFDNSNFDIDVTIKHNISYNRATKLLLSNTTSSNSRFMVKVCESRICRIRGKVPVPPQAA